MIPYCYQSRLSGIEDKRITGIWYGTTYKGLLGSWGEKTAENIIRLMNISK